MGSAPKTAFQKIAFFNTLIGNDNSSSFAGLQAQFACVKEEFEELEKALSTLVELNTNDCLAEEVEQWNIDNQAARVEFRDGIADVLVTVYGLAHRAGIDADKDLERVNISNMSKFLNHDLSKETTEQFMNRVEVEAATINGEKDLIVAVAETAPFVWALTSLKDQTGNDGKFYPKGKLLKPSTYKEPDFNAEVGVVFPCNLAPTGWGCSRVKGHEGPCAASMLGK